MLNKVVLPRESVVEGEMFLGHWKGTGIEVYRMVSEKDAVKKIHYNVKMSISKTPEGHYRVESEYFFTKKTKIQGIVYDKGEQSGDHYDYDAITNENRLQALSFYDEADPSSRLLEHFQIYDDKLHHKYTGQAMDSVFKQNRQPLLARLLGRASGDRFMLVTGTYLLERATDVVIDE